MTKRIVTFEVDQAQLFDMLHKAGSDGFAGLGNRLVSALLADTDVFEAIGMAVYGVTILPNEQEQPA